MSFEWPADSIPVKAGDSFKWPEDSIPVTADSKFEWPEDSIPVTTETKFEWPEDSIPVTPPTAKGLTGAINVVSQEKEVRPRSINWMLESSATVPEFLKPSQSRALKAVQAGATPEEAKRAEELVREVKRAPKTVEVPETIPEEEVGIKEELGYQVEKAFKNTPSVADVRESLKRLQANEYEQIADPGIRNRLYRKDLEKVSEWKLAQKEEGARKRTFGAEVTKFLGEMALPATEMGAISTVLELALPVAKTAKLGTKLAYRAARPLVESAISLGINPSQIAAMKPPEYDISTDSDGKNPRLEIKDLGDDSYIDMLGKAFLDQYLAFATAHLGAKLGTEAESIAAKKIAQILPEKTIASLKKTYVAGGGKLTEEGLKNALQTGAVGGEVQSTLHDLGVTVLNLHGEDKDLENRLVEYAKRRIDPNRIFTAAIGLSLIPVGARAATLEFGRRNLRSEAKATVTDAATITKEIAPQIVGEENAPPISDALFRISETMPSRKSFANQSKAKGKVLSELDKLADESNVYATKEQAEAVAKDNLNISAIKDVYRELSGSKEKSDEFVNRLLNVGEEKPEGGRTVDHLIPKKEEPNAIQEQGPETIYAREPSGDTGEKTAPRESREIRQSKEESRKAQEAQEDLKLYQDQGAGPELILEAKRAIKTATSLSKLYGDLDGVIGRASEALDKQEDALKIASEYEQAGDEASAKTALNEALKNEKAYVSFSDAAGKINARISKLEESRQEPAVEVKAPVEIEKKTLSAQEQAEQQREGLLQLSVEKAEEAKQARADGNERKAATLQNESDVLLKRAEILEDKTTVAPPKKSLVMPKEEIGKRPVAFGVEETPEKTAQAEYRRQKEPERIAGIKAAVKEATKTGPQKAADYLTDAKLKREYWGKTAAELQKKADESTSQFDRAKYQQAAKYAQERERTHAYAESFHEQQLKRVHERKAQQEQKERDRSAKAEKEAGLGRVGKALKILGLSSEAAKETETAIKARIATEKEKLTAKFDKALEAHKARMDDIKNEAAKLKEKYKGAKQESVDAKNAVKYLTDYISKKVVATRKTLQGKEVPVGVSPSYMKSVNRILSGVDDWTSLSKALDKIDDLADRSARRLLVRDIVKSLAVAKNNNTESNKNVVRPLMEEIKSKYYNDRISEDSMDFYNENKGKKSLSLDDQERVNRIEQRLENQKGKRYLGDLTVQELQDLQHKVIETDLIAREQWKLDQELTTKKVKGDIGSIASRKQGVNELKDIILTPEDIDWYIKHKDKFISNPEERARMDDITSKLESIPSLIKGKSVKGKASEFWENLKKGALYLGINRHMIDWLDNNKRGEAFTGPIFRIFSSDVDAVQERYVRRKIKYLDDGLKEATKKYGKLTKREDFLLHMHALLQQKNGEQYLLRSGANLKDIREASTLNPRQKAYYDYMRKVFDEMGPEAQQAAGKYWAYDMKLEDNYFPITYEPEQGESANYNQYRKPSLSPAGAMLSRKGPSAEQKLQLGAMEAFRGTVEDMLYQTEVRPYLKQLHQLVNDSGFEKAVGKRNQEILADYVKRADLQWRVPAQYKGLWGKASGWLLRATRRGLLLFNPKTVIKMATGSVQTPIMYGAKNAFYGYLDLTSKENIEYLKDNLPEIYQRSSTGGVQVEERAENKIERIGYGFLGKMDALAVWPATFAAIRKWHEDHGKTPDFTKPLPRAAKDYVNTTINEMFGTSSNRERSRLVTGGENARFWRDITSLGSFMQTMTSTFAHTIMKKPPPLALKVLGALYATRAVDWGVDALFNTHESDDDEKVGDFLFDMGTYPIEGLPLSNNVLSWYKYGWNSSSLLPVKYSGIFNTLKEVAYMAQSKSAEKKQKHATMALIKGLETGGIPLKSLEQLYKMTQER